MYWSGFSSPLAILIPFHFARRRERFCSTVAGRSLRYIRLFHISFWYSVGANALSPRIVPVILDFCLRAFCSAHRTPNERNFSILFNDIRQFPMIDIHRYTHTYNSELCACGLFAMHFVAFVYENEPSYGPSVCTNIFQIGVEIHFIANTYFTHFLSFFFSHLPVSLSLERLEVAT